MQSETSIKIRYPEIDFFRGTALLMMLISNFVTDLQYFFAYSDFEAFWYWFARVTAGMFIFISGLSLWISHFKARGFEKYLRRFAKLFGLGILITAVTGIFLPAGTIYFGILHFLGVASLLAIPFLRFGIMNVFLSTIFFAGTTVVMNYHSDHLFLLPLGITPTSFFTFDYFPLFPWFGVFLLGLGFGGFAYPDGARKIALSFPEKGFFGFIEFIGRHTLKIYLVHQPVFVMILLILSGGRLEGIMLPWVG